MCGRGRSAFCRCSSPTRPTSSSSPPTTTLGCKSRWGLLWPLKTHFFSPQHQRQGLSATRAGEDCLTRGYTYSDLYIFFSFVSTHSKACVREQVRTAWPHQNGGGFTLTFFKTITYKHTNTMQMKCCVWRYKIAIFLQLQVDWKYTSFESVTLSEKKDAFYTIHIYLFSWQLFVLFACVANVFHWFGLNCRLIYAKGCSTFIAMWWWIHKWTKELGKFWNICSALVNWASNFFLMFTKKKKLTLYGFCLSFVCLFRWSSVTGEELVIESLLILIFN